MEYYGLNDKFSNASSDTLQHWGVKGMKWGVRRYRNKDGSLTAAGKARRTSDDSDISEDNLSRNVGPKATEKAMKNGLLDKNGYYLTEKGHLSEVSRRKKLSPEESDAELKALCKDWLTEPNDPNFDDAVNRSARINAEINMFVMDAYSSYGVTARTKQILAEYDEMMEKFEGSYHSSEFKQKAEPYDKLLDSECLKELGYSDTEAGRKYIRPLWDSHGMYPNDYLDHSGIKGMKWGVRRYQNKDGSLTALGQIRYGAGKAGDKAKAAVKRAVENHKTKRANAKESKRIEALMKKPVSKLTDAELTERTSLAQKQKALRDIESQSKTLENNAKSFMNKFGSKMLNEALVPAAVSAGKSAVTKLLTNKLEKALGVGGDGGNDDEEEED